MKELASTQVVGVDQLRRNLPKLLRELTGGGRELVITRQGKPAAVLIDIEKYLEVQRALEEFSDPEYVRSLLNARDEIRGGRGLPAEDVFRKKGA